VNPQCYRKLCICLARSWCPDVKVEAVLAVWRLLTITPLSSISAWIVNCLIAWVSESVGDLYAFPRNYWLRLFPTEVTDRRCCIRDTSINCNAFNVGWNSLYLTTFDGKHRILLLCACCKQQWEKQIS
jgi:hypothetical protein